MVDQVLGLLLVSWSIFSTAVVTHCVVIFYAKDFSLSDFEPTNARCKFQRYYQNNPSTRLKAIACGSVIGFCKCSSWMSVKRSRLLMFLLALPQLYRMKGSHSQQLRVTMGPLTPILALHILLRHIDLISVLQVVICFLAFALLRPDNTAVIDIVVTGPFEKPFKQFLSDGKTRRKLHGILAATNTAFSLASLMEDHRFPSFHFEMITNRGVHQN